MPQKTSKKEDKKFKKQLEDTALFFDSSKLKNPKINNPKEAATLKKRTIDSSNKPGSEEVFNNEQIVNFIPDDVSTIPSQTKRLILLVLACMFIVFINAISYMSLIDYKISLNDDIEKIIDSNDSINKEYLAQKKILDESTKTKNKIDNINTLLENHIYWTNFFSILKNNLLKNIEIKGMSGDSSGQISISMEAPSYKDMALQASKFKSIDLVNGIVINNAYLNNSGYGVSFDLGISIDKKVFLNKQ